jgi:hypothetical protein
MRVPLLVVVLAIPVWVLMISVPVRTTAPLAEMVTVLAATVALRFALDTPLTRTGSGCAAGAKVAPPVESVNVKSSPLASVLAPRIWSWMGLLVAPPGSVRGCTEQVPEASACVLDNSSAIAKTSESFRRRTIQSAPATESRLNSPELGSPGVALQAPPPMTLPVMPDPGTPVAPVAPVGPVLPIFPMLPIAPGAPSAPMVPVGPGTPS